PRVLEILPTPASVLFNLDRAIFFYFIGVNSFYTLLLFLSIPEMISNYIISKDEHLNGLFTSEAAPGISLLAPAYNEEATITDSLHSMLSLEYPNIEVIVINDGSRDKTMEVMKSSFELFEIPLIYRHVVETKEFRGIYKSRKFANMTVVDKENGGKADALNAGLNVARTPLVCAMDADTLIDPDALLRMVRSYLMKENVVAVGGTIRIANGCKIEKSRVIDVRAPRKFIPAVQIVEYLRAFLFGRMGLNRLGGNLVISGAFGLFHRESVLEVGGYAHDTVGEDMELVVRLHRYMKENKRKYWIDFVPDPVAWTEVPESLKVLSRQRDRWHRGLTDTLLRHKKMLLNPMYGALGLVVYPYFFFVELLAPVVELFGYLGLASGLYFHVVNWYFALLFFIAAYGLGVVLSLYCLVLDEAFFHKYARFRDVLFLLGIALLENLGYRQLTVFWRINGMIKYFRGIKTWGKMERVGFAKRS
ncbi:MAG TPA: glycosyltransferase, partial [bacterium]|nr:glycosyltransferase [bacterium]